MSNNANYVVETYTIPKMLSIKEAAQEFHLSEGTVRGWITAGQLPVVRCGKRFLINCTVLSKFLEGETVAVPQPQPQTPAAVGSAGQIYVCDKGSGKARLKPIY